MYLCLARTFLYSSALQYAIEFVAAILIDGREWLDVHVRVANSAYRGGRKCWDCQRCGSSRNRSSFRFLWHQCALYLRHDRDRQSRQQCFRGPDRRWQLRNCRDCVWRALVSIRSLECAPGSCFPSHLIFLL